MEIIPRCYRRERDRNQVEKVNHLMCGAEALWVGLGLCRSNLEINQAEPRVIINVSSYP